MEREKEIKSKTLNLALTEEQEAAAFRESILAGLQDAIQGRTIEFSGDLRADLKRAKELFGDK